MNVIASTQFKQKVIWKSIKSKSVDQNFVFTKADKGNKDDNIAQNIQYISSANFDIFKTRFCQQMYKVKNVKNISYLR